MDTVDEAIKLRGGTTDRSTAAFAVVPISITAMPHLVYGCAFMARQLVPPILRN